MANSRNRDKGTCKGQYHRLRLALPLATNGNLAHSSPDKCVHSHPLCLVQMALSYHKA
ncbi:Uncharacterised protein [Vibrio cholerae]|nr:Uncharacterised protein [Vibrio cholerae]